jgi:hypothetical protein
VALVGFTIAPAISTSAASAQDAWSAATDRRVRYIASVLNCIKAVKLSAYESSLFKTGLRLKEDELVAMRHYRWRWLWLGLSYNGVFWLLRLCYITYAFTSDSLERVPALTVLAVILGMATPFFETVW